MPSNKDVNNMLGSLLGHDPEEIVCIATVVLFRDGSVVVGGPPSLVCIGHSAVHADDDNSTEHDPMKGFIPDENN
jgi:hypothetical protein